MRQTIRWSQEEAIILLNALLLVLDNKMPRKLAVSLVSNELRKRALDSGLEIDDIFRNTNGIQLQMSTMEYLFTEGKRGLKKTYVPQVFEEIVNLYKTNPQEFYVQLSQISGGVPLAADNKKVARSSSQEVISRNEKKTNNLPFETDNRHKKRISQVTAKTVGKKGPNPSELKGEQRAFFQWLKKSGYSSSSALSVIVALETCSNMTISDDTQVDFFIISKQRQLIKAMAALKKKSGFIERDKLSGGKYSEALELLFQFKQGKPMVGTLDIQQQERMKLNQKLYSISKVYDDPSGLKISKIMSLLGEKTDEKLVREILDDASWARRLSDDTYTFQKESRHKVSKTVAIIKEPTDFDKEKFEQTLLHRYRSGMQFDSIDFENFREMYKMLFNESLLFNDAELEERLRLCGVFYKDRLFPAAGVIDEATKEKLFAYIKNSFSSGKKVLYYKAIFEELSDIFASCFTLRDENMLRAYIEYTADKGAYYFSPNYMSTEKKVSIDHSSEVENYLLNAGKPLTINNVSEGLSHIPKDTIAWILSNDGRFLRNAKGEYFHVDIFEVSEAELESIAKIIDEFIQENEYAIWTNVWNIIQKTMPAFLENNPYLYGLGFRNAIAQQLTKRFNFESAVISMPNKRYAMRDIFTLYGKHHAEFTSDDIYYLSKELDTVINYDALAEVSVRVSHDLFIAKNKISFDVDAVDKAIGSFISKDYICIRDIDSFLSFPNVEYEWNEYLLESYVNSFSKKYILLNNGFALNNVAGAVVKKTGLIRDFVDACAAVLADAPIALNKKDALNYLADVNMITRRSYKDLESAISKATQIRARKG